MEPIITNFEYLKGKTITEMSIGVFESSSNDNEYVSFIANDSDFEYEYILYHDANVTNSVCIEDITGNIIDILDSIILLAESSFSEKINKGDTTTWGGDILASERWTYYRLNTSIGSVTIKWHGNGTYCNISPDFYLKSKKAKS